MPDSANQKLSQILNEIERNLKREDNIENATAFIWVRRRILDEFPFLKENKKQNP